MQKLMNYETLLQLSVGLNLVIGAYSSHRKNVEDRVKDSLSTYREQMDDILECTSEPITNIASNLQDRPIKELSDRELSRYLSDCTVRFYQRRERFMRRDGLVEPMLYPAGLLSLICLIYSTYWPKTQVSYIAAYAATMLFLGPAILSLARLLLETKHHERFYRGDWSNSYRRRVEERHKERLRTTEKDGEIIRVTNAVRLRHSALQISRRRARHSE